MRNMGKSAVVGANNIIIDEEKQLLLCGTTHNVTIRKGDIITLDGSSGTVYIGKFRCFINNIIN